MISTGFSSTARRYHRMRKTTTYTVVFTYLHLWFFSSDIFSVFVDLGFEGIWSCMIATNFSQIMMVVYNIGWKPHKLDWMCGKIDLIETNVC